MKSLLFKKRKKKNKKEIRIKKKKLDRRKTQEETTMASKSSTPPYPSAARISDSPCYPQYSASLKCLEEYQSDKSKCQEHFDIYKECKKKEREARLERNSKRSFFS